MTVDHDVHVQEMRELGNRERQEALEWLHRRQNQLRIAVGQKPVIYPENLRDMGKAINSVFRQLANAVLPVMRQMVAVLNDTDQLPSLRLALESAKEHDDVMAVAGLTEWISRLESKL